MQLKGFQKNTIKFEKYCTVLLLFSPLRRKGAADSFDTVFNQCILWINVGVFK